jgi:hypothetical protein
MMARHNDASVCDYRCSDSYHHVFDSDPIDQPGRMALILGDSAAQVGRIIQQGSAFLAANHFFFSI